MRQKENKVIVTFHTTAEAIAMEKACLNGGIPGRLIPVPRQISSGCGLAYCGAAELDEMVLKYMKQNDMHYEAVGVYLI